MATVRIRKPLHARKTMTPSSRKQMELLNKMKKGATVPSDGASSENKDLCVTSSDVKQFLNAGALQDILYSWYENESSSPLCQPVEVHLNAEPAGWASDCPEERISVSLPAGEASAPETGTRTGEMVAGEIIPGLEKGDANFQPQKENTASPVLASTRGDPERKRRASENDIGQFCKRMRTSEGAREERPGSSEKTQLGLGKVKGFIEQQLAASMQALDHKLQHLHERIDRTQCLRKHEGISIKIVKKISRLNRCINGLVDSQKRKPPSEANLPGTSSQDTILNCTTTLPDSTSSRPMPSQNVSSDLSKTPPETPARFDPVVCLDEEEENSGGRAVTPPGAPQEKISTDTDHSAAAPSYSKLQNLLVIDLTDEEVQADKDKEAEGRAAARRNSAVDSGKPGPSPAVLPLPDQTPEDFSHLPPLPKIRLHPESAGRFWGTLPPQKLTLSVALLENPKGIGLRWNIQKVDPRCADIKSFHLFLYLEGSKIRSPSSWVKTNEIQALPLPMACSLADFPGSTKCYFTMQAKDVYGRYGPFCDIQSIFYA